MQTARPSAIVALAAALVACHGKTDAAAGPGADQRRDLAALGKRVRGYVVWESNRTGNWELYRMNTDGSGFVRLTSLKQQLGRARFRGYMRPRPSPDGEVILFAYSSESRCEVWIARASGGPAARLTKGNPLNWSCDGRFIYFVRDHRVWRRAVATGTEQKISESRVPAGGDDGHMVGAVRWDLRAAVFRTRKNEYVNLATGKVEKTTGGCEPGFTADGKFMYWVNKPRHFRVWHIGRNKEWEYFGTPPTKPCDYTYFPTISADRRWLTYGASPGQHNHSSSDYEIFIQELRDWKPVGGPVRLSWHKRTDRWPALHVFTDGTKPASTRETPGDGPCRY